MALIKLNQKFINLERKSQLTDSNSKFYLETSLNSLDRTETESVKNEIIRFNSAIVITGTDLNALKEDQNTYYVIPYTTILFIKDSKQFWTHGQLYEGTDENSEYGIDSNKNQILQISGSNYILSMDAQNKFYITKETPASISIAKDGSETTSYSIDGVSDATKTYYDGKTHSCVVTSIPPNKFKVTVNPGTHTVKITDVSVGKTSSTNTKTSISHDNIGKDLTSSTTLNFTIPSTHAAFVGGASKTSNISSGTVSSGNPDEQYVTVTYLLDGVAKTANQTITNNATSINVAQVYKYYYATNPSTTFTTSSSEPSTGTADGRTYLYATFSAGTTPVFCWPADKSQNVYALTTGGDLAGATNNEITMFKFGADITLHNRTYKVYYRQAAITNAGVYKVTLEKQ